MIPRPGIPLWVLEHWNLQFALTSTSFTFMHGLGAIDTTVKTGPGNSPASKLLATSVVTRRSRVMAIIDLGPTLLHVANWLMATTHPK